MLQEGGGRPAVSTPGNPCFTCTALGIGRAWTTLPGGAQPRTPGSSKSKGPAGPQGHHLQPPPRRAEKPALSPMPHNVTLSQGRAAHHTGRAGVRAGREMQPRLTMQRLNQYIKREGSFGQEGTLEMGRGGPSRRTAWGGFARHVNIQTGLPRSRAGYLSPRTTCRRG